MLVKNIIFKSFTSGGSFLERYFKGFSKTSPGPSTACYWRKVFLNLFFIILHQLRAFECAAIMFDEEARFDKGIKIIKNKNFGKQFTK